MSDPQNPAVPPSPSPASPLPPDNKDARMWNMWCHLSALAGLVLPLGNLIGPLVVWQMKKNEFPSVDVHGRAALNFQITVTIAVVGGFIAGLLLSFVCVGWLVFPLVGVVAICGLVFAVIAGIKANDGTDYSYPYSLKLV